MQQKTIDKWSDEFNRGEKKNSDLTEKELGYLENGWCW